jgi:predicted metal-binding protein
MSDEIVPQDREVVRSYQVPWKGQLVLVCRKCQKKLKHGGKRKGIAKLGKALKKRARDAEDGLKLHVIEVPCLKMCPKEGVTVCTQRQLGRGECSIVWSGADVDALIENM